MNILKRISAYFRLKKAILMAEKAHKKNGQRYYVIPGHPSKPTLLVVDRRNFRLLKRKGYINPNVYIADLDKDCIYKTPDRKGHGRTKEDFCTLFRLYID